MNKIEEIQDSVNKYVNDICKKDDYSHLKVKISTHVKSDADSRITIDSNAFIGIKGSLAVDSLISKYINQLFEDYHGSENYHFRIEYSIANSQKPNVHANHDSDSEIIQCFLSEKPKYKLSSMVLPKPKWEELNHALSMVKNYSRIYKDWGFEEIDPSSKTILCFYGKAGTGKTKCAHAVADYFDKPIICASYADIQSQYVGVGPKNLRNIFKQAEEDDSVLFFDEADAFLRKRSSDTDSSAAMHYNSMTNEMMKHLEDFNGLVIFATNLTENIDDAFMTRITASIEFPVPDLESRIALIKKLIPSKIPVNSPYSEDDYKRIAEKCDGFVGRDIRNAIKATLSDAAENKLEYITPQLFESVFEQYKSSKDALAADINGTKINSPIYEQIEWNTANSAVLAICSYMAWFDGQETDEETTRLKQIAKQLNRDKLIITKLADLPSLEELCDKIKLRKQKIETLSLAASVLALSCTKEVSFDLMKQLCDNFSLDDSMLSYAKQLYIDYQSIFSISSHMKEVES